MGASGVSGSSKAGGRVCEDTGEELNNSSEAHAACRAARQRLRDARPAGEGRSGGLEPLARPPLPGRKAHRKTHRGRWREGIQEREEAEHGVDKERRRGRQRWTDRTETHAESSSEVLETGDGSNFQMGQNDAITSPVCLNAPSPRSAAAAVSSVPLHPSNQNRPASLSSGTSAEELHHYPGTSSREPDPIWAVVRPGARAGKSSQNQHARTPFPSVGGSEQGEEEEEEGEGGDRGGEGVMEVAIQSARPRFPLGEKRMSKREKNRVKCLRRRQRRREVWRQGQLQESQQVSHTNVITLMLFFCPRLMILWLYRVSKERLHFLYLPPGGCFHQQCDSLRPRQPPARLNSHCLCGFK